MYKTERPRFPNISVKEEMEVESTNRPGKAPPIAPKVAAKPPKKDNEPLEDYKADIEAIFNANEKEVDEHAVNVERHRARSRSPRERKEAKPAVGRSPQNHQQ